MMGGEGEDGEKKTNTCKKNSKTNLVCGFRDDQTSLARDSAALPPHPSLPPHLSPFLPSFGLFDKTMFVPQGQLHAHN